MRMYDLIYKKRLGQELTDEEIAFIIRGYTDGSIPDYQMSALAMAICFRSMTDREIAALTQEMAHSGDMLDLSEFGPLTVDKHSTGGVGDKTSLAVGPIVAACGAKLAKMSGRGLGHTGGTVDKLASVEGYRTELSEEEFFAQVRRTGIAIIGQTGNMTPADKKLYALRDVTATVDSIPLIVSSIMSKKLAAGSGTIVLDVKMGSGAFMRDMPSATELAEKMVAIGKACGRKMTAFITDMDTPLGYAVGNSLEMMEAVDLLKNGTQGDLRTICLELSSAMLSLCFDISQQEAMEKAADALNSGRAYAKMLEWITAQGGNPAWVEDVSHFPKARYQRDVLAPQSGYILNTDTAMIGTASAQLGAGRVKAEDEIDFAAGLYLRRKRGDFVHRGECLATLYTNREETLPGAENCFLSAYTFGQKAPEPVPLILKKIL